MEEKNKDNIIEENTSESLNSDQPESEESAEKKEDDNAAGLADDGLSEPTDTGALPTDKEEPEMESDSQESKESGTEEPAPVEPEALDPDPAEEIVSEELPQEAKVTEGQKASPAPGEQKKGANPPEDGRQSKASQTAEYLDKIKSDTFIGQAGNVIFQGSMAPKEESSQPEKQFKDPSIPLSKAPEHLPQFVTPEMLREQYELLQERRVVLLNCTDEKTAYDAARHLAFHSPAGQYSVKQVLLGRNRDHTNLVLDNFLDQPIGGGQGNIIIVDVKSTPFFNSIISMDYSVSETLKDTLADKQTMVILSISTEYLIKSIYEYERQDKMHFPVWNLPGPTTIDISKEEAGKIMELINEKEHLEKIVLYVVTFFPGLTQEDFERVVLLLLDRVNKSKKKKQKLIETWNERPDAILINCGIGKVYSENYDSEVIDFIDPNARIVLKKFFEESHSFYIRHKVDSILDSGLLFDLSSNSQIIHNLIDLLLKKLSNNSQHNNVRLLWEISLSIANPDQYKIDLNCSLEELIQQLNEKQLLGVVRSNSMARFSLLIDAMLNDQNLKEVVHSYLDTLMEANYRGVVKELTEQLRFSPNFNKFYWIRRLLNEGKTEAKEDSYNFLVRLARHIGVRIYDFFDVIQDWVPTQELPVDNYSPANHYGLRFIVDYCILITQNFPFGFYGLFPSRYFLFATLDEDKKVTKEKITQVLSWLFHPGITRVFYQLRNIPKGKEIALFKSITNDLLGFKAELLEAWYAILTWKNDQTDEEDLEILDAISDCLIRSVIEITDTETQESLMHFWSSRLEDYTQAASYYLKNLSKASPTNTAARKELLESRELVLQRYQSLKRLQSNFKRIQIRKYLNIKS
ncbi:MAG: hypothetical protein H6557_16220 [Lewinellaceae bacterium]|nr:hypothetical protein [Phaeodactylibacter sp.]MCB9038162.1 hypothetical protein [Lewinellaceae bacterium]